MFVSTTGLQVRQQSQCHALLPLRVKVIHPVMSPIPERLHLAISLSQKTQKRMKGLTQS